MDGSQIAGTVGQAALLLRGRRADRDAGGCDGLAVTETGGDIQFIEADTDERGGRLTLTGQLGDVLKESANIALSYVRSRGASSV